MVHLQKEVKNNRTDREMKKIILGFIKKFCGGLNIEV